MKIQATEITEIIKRQIADYESTVEIAEVGTVIQAGDGIARIFGLEKAMAGELLDFPHDVTGMVLNLEEDNVGAVLFGEYEKIAEGDTVKRAGRIASVPVGEAMIAIIENENLSVPNRIGFLYEFYRNVSYLDVDYVVRELKRIQKSASSDERLERRIAATLDEIASLGPLDM
jgi:F0F1-type ATP synthase alpha subunit